MKKKRTPKILIKEPDVTGHFRMPDATHKKIKELSKKTRKPIKDVITEMTDLYDEVLQKQLKGR